MGGGLDWDGPLGVATAEQRKVLADAGLYDPSAATAEDRLDLLESLIAAGCTLEELVTANNRGRLFALLGDRILRPGRDTYTLREAAAQLGGDLPFILRVWRALGLPDVGADTPVASPEDVSVLPVCIGMREAWGEDTVLGLARAYGAALDRIAHAEVDATRPVASNISLEYSGSERLTSDSWAVAVMGVVEIGRLLDVAHRHHLENAMRRTEVAMSGDLASRRSLRQAVGFVDLCGFTALSGSVDADTLSGWLTMLEESAYDVVAEHDGRVVKFIGDEVMMVTGHAAELARVLLTMQSWTQGGEFRIRGGAAFGEVLAQEGDYFGPPVNLAARLVAVAEPGTVLVSPEFADALGEEEFETTLLEPVTLRGFASPVSPYRLEIRPG